MHGDIWGNIVNIAFLWNVCICTVRELGCGKTSGHEATNTVWVFHWAFCKPCSNCSPLGFHPSVPDTAPTDVEGGGGTKTELVITWEVSHHSHFYCYIRCRVMLLLNCAELNGAILWDHIRERAPRAPSALSLSLSLSLIWEQGQRAFALEQWFLTRVRSNTRGSVSHSQGFGRGQDTHRTARYTREMSGRFVGRKKKIACWNFGNTPVFFFPTLFEDGRREN